jgi:hypothetical protein
MTVISSWITCFLFIAFGVYFPIRPTSNEGHSMSQAERDEEDSPPSGDWGG